MSGCLKIRSMDSPGSFQVNLPGPIQITFGDEDQMVMWENGILRIVDRIEEATRIQSWWRARMAKVRVQQVREEIEMEADAWSTIVDDLHVEEDSEEEERELRILEREYSERVRADKERPIHGLPQGRGNGNEPGSFWISKKTWTVLSGGAPGDQKWSVGMKGEEYCPTMRIIGIGKHGAKHCICNCGSLIYT